MAEHVAVSKFREYLRIKTVHPNPDYSKCLQFLLEYSRELGLDFNSVEYVKGKPVIIITWKGSNPNLTSIMLNSHTDVVPVSQDKWHYPPFEAVKAENGDIFARGSQDMKCVGIWYMEAIRELKQREISGADGMKLFIASKEFKDLNIGFALDEGLANEENAFKAYYGERAPWWIKLTAKGGAGHASKFIEPNASIRLIRVLNKFADFRASEKQRLGFSTTESGRPLTLGDVTSTNITLLNAGVQFNVVPEEATAGIDMRVAPTVNKEELLKTLKSWCDEEQVDFKFEQVFWGNGMTDLKNCREWDCIKQVANKLNIKLDPEIFPAATDCRYIRQTGIPAIGISAIRNTPVLLHDHDEFLNEKTLIDGIEFYRKVLSEIANLE